MYLILPFLLLWSAVAFPVEPDSTQVVLAADKDTFSGWFDPRTNGGQFLDVSGLFRDIAYFCDPFSSSQPRNTESP